MKKRIASLLITLSAMLLISALHADMACPGPDAVPAVIEQGCADSCVEACSNACATACEKAVGPGGECQFDVKNPDKACYWCEESTMAKCQVVCGCGS